MAHGNKTLEKLLVINLEIPKIIFTYKSLRVGMSFFYLGGIFMSL